MPQKAIALQNVNIWQAESGEQRNKTVLLKEGRFVAVLDNNEALPAGYEVKAGNGQWLVPGIIDMHAHILDPAELSAYLAHGVTTIRNMNGRPMHLEMKRQLSAGKLAGPRLMTLGPTLNFQSPLMQFHQNVNTAAQAKTVVAQIKRAGYDGLKFYDGLSPEIFEALVAHAEAEKMPIAGHIPNKVGLAPVLKHYKTMEHVDELWQNGLAKAKSGDEEKMIAALSQANKPLVASLAIMQRLGPVCGKGEQVIDQYETPLLSPLANFFGRKSLKGFAVGDEGCAQFRERVSKITRLVKKLHEAQVPILLGSDQGPHLFAAGVASGQEADALLNAGLSITEVMRSATTLAAQALGRENDVGKIAPGFRADAILLAGHPLAKAPWRQTPGAILADGRWYGQPEREALLQAARGHGSFWLALGRFLQGDE